MKKQRISALKITEDIAIEELVRQLPESVSLLMDHGIICIKCGEPVWGTLKEKFEEKKIENREEILSQLNKLSK